MQAAAHHWTMPRPWRGAGEACEFGPRGGTDGRGRVLIAQTTYRAANHPLLRPLTRAQSARLTRSSTHLISARALHMRSAAGWRVRIRATGRRWRAWAGVGTLCDAPRRESRPPGPHNPRSGRAPATHLNARARTQSGDAAGRGKRLRRRNRPNFCRAPVYDSWMPRSHKTRFNATWSTRIPAPARGQLPERSVFGDWLRARREDALVRRGARGGGAREGRGAGVRYVASLRAAPRAPAHQISRLAGRAL